MRIGPDQQPLSYDVRLPDWVQADALRLLDASRAVVNALLARLWSRLDEFWGERSGPAWKQVVAMTESPDPHGNRQFRCESETAGRILRAQAERKQVFALIRPILSDGFIRPTHDARPAGKNRKTIKEAIQRLQTMLEEDDTAFVTMQNVVEQACNYFLKHGEFPTSYEQMQGMLLLKVGLLTYAGDDGGAKGQAYRFSLDRDAGTASLLFRCPDEAGRWHWQKDPVTLALPSCVLSRLKEGVPMAPTLRELVKADGSRVAVLDVIVQVPKTSLAAWKTVQRVLGFDWGVRGLITAVVLSAAGQQLSKPLFLDTGGLDGHQARMRRQIDVLKAARDKLAEGDPKRAAYSQEINRCWRLYEARNRELAHLAQQHDDPLRDLAYCALQKPPGGHALPFGAPTRHIAYLPSLWQACPHLSLPASTPSQRSREMGTLARLFPLCLQCRPRLLRSGQHRTARGGVPDPDASHRQSKSLFGDRCDLGQAVSLYGTRRGAAVSAADPGGSPAGSGQNLHQWVEKILYHPLFLC